MLSRILSQKMWWSSCERFLKATEATNFHVFFNISNKFNNFLPFIMFKYQQHNTFLDSFNFSQMKTSDGCEWIENRLQIQLLVGFGYTKAKAIMINIYTKAGYSWLNKKIYCFLLLLNFKCAMRCWVREVVEEKWNSSFR